MRATTLIMLLALAGCRDHTDTCEALDGTVTATRTSGCGEPTQAELDAILADDGTPCWVRDRADAMCTTTLETECEPEPGRIWEWTGTLAYDGDGYSGRLRRRELVDGVLCNGEFWVEVRR